MVSLCTEEEMCPASSVAMAPCSHTLRPAVLWREEGRDPSKSPGPGYRHNTPVPSRDPGETTEMPPKLKVKSLKKKKGKKPKDGAGSVEEKFRKATLEVDVLQDHLALQRQVTRQAQQRKYELRGKVQELQEDIQDERDEKQAIYSEMTRQHRDLEQQSSARIQHLEEEVAELKLQLSESQQAYQSLSEESERVTKEKEAEIEELKKQVESMETEYEHILHSSLDQILSKLALAGQQWEKEALTIHQQYKRMLQDCGLNPLDI